MTVEAKIMATAVGRGQMLVGPASVWASQVDRTADCWAALLRGGQRG
jgi:hypothetical protein